MANVILPVFILVGIILCIFCARSRNKLKINMLCLILGLAALFISFLTFEFTYSMKLDISKRELLQTAQEETVYQLITIEPNKENTEFHFYYRTEYEGAEGFDHKTISSENIFVVETNHTKPMIIETTTLYQYPLSKFEKWWLGERYVESLEKQATYFYEIYVPEGTLAREYNLK